MSRRDYPARRAWRTLGRTVGWLRARVGRLPVVRRLSLPSGRQTLDAVALAAVGAAVATVAGATPAWLVQSTASVARPVLGLLGVACVVLVLLGWDREATDHWTETLREAAPERVPAGVGTPPGAWVTLAAGEESRIAEASLVDQAGDAVARDRLVEAATTAVAADAGVSEETAAGMVASGEWTDDPRAAAYLADGETPTVPPGTRLRDWLAGQRTPRRVRAAAREIRRCAAASSAVEADEGIDASVTAASATLADAVESASASDDTARDDSTETALLAGPDREATAPDGGQTLAAADDPSEPAGDETADSDDESEGSTVRPTGLHATWWEVDE